MIPSDSIPPKFLTPVANREGIYQRCSGNTVTQLDSSTLYLVRDNSDKGRDTTTTIFNVTRNILCMFEKVVGV